MIRWTGKYSAFMPNTTNAVRAAKHAVLVPRRHHHCAKLLITSRVVGTIVANGRGRWASCDCHWCDCICRMRSRCCGDGPRRLRERIAADRRVRSGSSSRSINGSVPRASWMLPRAVAAIRRRTGSECFRYGRMIGTACGPNSASRDMPTCSSPTSPAPQARMTGSTQGECTTTQVGNSLGAPIQHANQTPNSTKSAKVPSRTIALVRCGVVTMAVLEDMAGPYG